YLPGERVGREPGWQGAGGDRERHVAHLAALLDEARSRTAATELAIVGVRGEDERPLPGGDHRASIVCVPVAIMSPGLRERRRRVGRRRSREQPCPASWARARP